MAQKAQCLLCPHRCRLAEGRCGVCRARICREGKVIDLAYAQISALALDPIEKKPLRRFHPGSWILSLGSCGCNLRCPFCQNSGISMRAPDPRDETLLPEDLVALALKLKESDPRGNLGVAFTYNEMLAPHYEYVRDCAALAKERGLATVLVTNGFIEERPLLELLPLIDAANVDLKGFSEGFYKWLGGSLKSVKRSLELMAGKIHLEVTTLVIPGKNDSAEEMDAECAFLEALSPEIPLHLSRFFPRYKCADLPPTPPETVLSLCDIARRRLKYVFPGNM